MTTRMFGPKKADHPSIGVLCPICGRPFGEGDLTKLVAIGPANDAEGQKAKEGRAHMLIAEEVHWSCNETARTTDKET